MLQEMDAWILCKIEKDLTHKEKESTMIDAIVGATLLLVSVGVAISLVKAYVEDFKPIKRKDKIK